MSRSIVANANHERMAALDLMVCSRVYKMFHTYCRGPLRVTCSVLKRVKISRLGFSVTCIVSRRQNLCPGRPSTEPLHAPV